MYTPVHSNLVVVHGYFQNCGCILCHALRTSQKALSPPEHQAFLCLCPISFYLFQNRIVYPFLSMLSLFQLIFQSNSFKFQNHGDNQQWVPDTTPFPASPVSFLLSPNPPLPPPLLLFLFPLLFPDSYIDCAFF